jgi:hypothetical protein
MSKFSSIGANSANTITYQADSNNQLDKLKNNIPVKISNNLSVFKEVSKEIFELKQIFMNPGESLAVCVKKLDGILRTIEMKIGSMALAGLLKSIGFLGLIKKLNPIIYIASDINENAKPAISPTISYVTSLLFEKRNVWTEIEAKAYARMSSDIYNPTMITNGNCGLISAQNVFNSIQSTENTQWPRIPAGMFSDASRSLNKLGEKKVASTPLQKKDGSVSNNLDSFLEALNRYTASGGVIRASIFGLPPLDAKFPVKRNGENDPPMFVHSINFLRTKDNKLTMIDSQLGQTVVGEGAIRKYLAAYKNSFMPSVIYAVP